MRNPLDARKTFTGVRYTFPDFRPTWVRMPKPGSQPAKMLVIRFVIAMLIFASHRFWNRISSMPVVATARISMAVMLTVYLQPGVLGVGSSVGRCRSAVEQQVT